MGQSRDAVWPSQEAHADPAPQTQACCTLDGCHISRSSRGHATVFHPKHLQLLSKGFLTLQLRLRLSNSLHSTVSEETKGILCTNTQSRQPQAAFSQTCWTCTGSKVRLFAACVQSRGGSLNCDLLSNRLSTRQPCASSKSEVPAKNTEGPVTELHAPGLPPSGDNNYHAHFMDQRNVFTFTLVSYKLFHCSFFYL